ncbi:MAG: hypothetical protein JW719_00380, partial [Pirellulales bacterium]|nr:hypothetical protein [Pirellulales bacterium]
MKNHGMFHAMAWKDYRELRTFWVATVILAAALQAVVGVMTTRLGMAQYTIVPMLALVLVAPALYALGCAAMMFAGERESGMYFFLRALPVDPGRLLVCRTVFVLASTLLMLVVTCGSFVVLNRVLSVGVGDVARNIGCFAIVPLEMYVFGVFFSLTSRRPLTVLLLGAVFGTCVPTSIVLAFKLSGFFDSSANWWLPALAVRLVIIGLIAVVDVWLAARWFHDNGLLRGKRPRLRHTIPIRASADSALSFSTTIKSTSEFGRLLWQQWRQSQRLGGIFVLIALSLAVGFLALGSFHNGDGYSIAFLMMLLLSLVGACVFQDDWREERYRFLANCGASPGRVWLTRQLVWLAVAAVITLICIVATWFTLPDDLDTGSSVSFFMLSHAPLSGLVPCLRLFASSSQEVSGPVIVAFVVIFVPATVLLAAYACGQFCSIYTRSSIVASVASIGLLLALIIWAVIMSALWIDWLWSVAPIPVALLVATRLRTSDWMLGRADWRAWARSIIVPIATIVVIFAVIPFHRLYSVPKVVLDFPPEAASQATPEDFATARMYAEAIAIFVYQARENNQEEPENVIERPFFLADQPNAKFSASPLSPESIAWVKDNQKTIEITLRASRRSRCPFSFFDARSTVSSSDLMTLWRLLIASAEHLTAEGKLDAALDHYLGAIRVMNHLQQSDVDGWHSLFSPWVERGLLCWTAHPDQTPEQIERALKAYLELKTPCPSFIAEIAYGWRCDRKKLAEIDTLHDHRRRDAYNSYKNFAESIQAKALELFPWERARVRRIIDYAAFQEASKLRKVETALSENRKVEFPRIDYDKAFMLDALRNSTCMPDSFESSGTCCFMGKLVLTTTKNRAFRLQMALAAWRRRHGKLPKSLDELIGTYLDAMPIDPYTGKPFWYFPEGVPKAEMGNAYDPRLFPPEGLGPFILSSPPRASEDEVNAPGDHLRFSELQDGF